MKKLILFFGVALTLLSACKKVDPIEQFQTKLMGTWNITHARLDSSDPWIDVSAAGDQIVVTECTMNPWKPSYTIVDENTFRVPFGSSSTTDVDVCFTDGYSVWTFSDNSQFKLVPN